MPANLPPEYFKIEARLREARGPAEKTACLEEMMAVIPKHKGTDKLRADIRRKLSKLKDAGQARKKAGKHESAFQIDKEGAGRVLVVGLPNTGKSALVAALTNAAPQVSESPFTTWAPLPGMMHVDNIQIQLIDTPPLNRNYVESELMNLIRTGDLLLLLLDLQADPIHQLEETVAMLKEYKILLSGMDTAGATERGTLVMPYIAAVNKNDDEKSNEDFKVLCELLDQKQPLISVSAKNGGNLDQLKQAIFKGLDIIRIYSKPPGKEPDRRNPFVLKNGSTVEDFAAKVHKEFIQKFKTARVWGSTIFQGQMVKRDHMLSDGDVVELHL
jgi:ribosome-interacting GTPase 1